MNRKGRKERYEESEGKGERILGPVLCLRTLFVGTTKENMYSQ